MLRKTQADREGHNGLREYDSLWMESWQCFEGNQSPNLVAEAQGGAGQFRQVSLKKRAKRVKTRVFTFKRLTVDFDVEIHICE